VFRSRKLSLGLGELFFLALHLFFKGLIVCQKLPDFSFLSIQLLILGFDDGFKIVYLTM
jgi:hypothetical protein